MNIIKKKVFVSYSRKDEALIIPLVELMRASYAFVFRDSDSIPKGKKWRPELEKALLSSSRVIVFWSGNARESDWVRYECELACENQIDIVPVQLDNTEFPSFLKEFQGISLVERMLGMDEDFFRLFGNGDAADIILNELANRDKHSDPL